MKEYKEYCEGLSWRELPRGAGLIAPDYLVVKRSSGVAGATRLEGNRAFFSKNSFGNQTDQAYKAGKSFFMPYEFLE